MVKQWATLALALFFLASCGGSSTTNTNYTDAESINVAAISGTYLTQTNHSAWGKSDCLGCHQNFKHSISTQSYSRNAYQNLIENAVSAVGDTNAIEICSACHGTNGVSGTTRRCLICHNQMDKVHFHSGISGKQSPHDFNGNGMDDQDCIVCHWQPDMDGLFEPDTDLAKYEGIVCTSTNDLCLACHRANPLTAGEDRDGDGSVDEEVNVSSAPDIRSYYSSDIHAKNDATLSGKRFYIMKLSGENLYPDNGTDSIYSGATPLLCIQCHNPHRSSNDKLIVETARETLSVEKRVSQSDRGYTYSKVAVIDTASGAQFNMNYSTDETGLTIDSFSNKTISNNSTSTDDRNRQTVNSLCAACHDGNYNSNVNNLSLPIDINNHYAGQGSCVDCHSHGKLQF